MALKAEHWPEIEPYEIGNVKIEPVSDLGIMSIATPKGGKTALEKAIKKSFGLELPMIGKSASGKGFALLGMQIDQHFLLFPYQDAWQAQKHQAAIGKAGYTTDQSDGWTIFRVSGADATRALARICKLDLHEDVFVVGNVARSIMEHMGAIIFRPSIDEFLILAASSSREDFAHALEVSARNVS